MGRLGRVPVIDQQNIKIDEFVKQNDTPFLSYSCWKISDKGQQI